MHCLFVRNIWNHNVKLSAKPLMFCNHCTRQRTCNKSKAFYIAQNADKSSPGSACFHADRELIRLLSISHSLMILYLRYYCRGSRWHIYAFHGHEIPCSRKTLYNYIDQGVLLQGISICAARSVTNVKPRKNVTRVSLSAKEFRIGRTYEDFQKFIQTYPDIPIVELDTVEGGRDNSTQAFLTIFFRNCSLMLILCYKRSHRSKS